MIVERGIHRSGEAYDDARDLSQEIATIDDSKPSQPGSNSVAEITDSRCGPVVAVEVGHHKEKGW